jgi:hypothetical protein
MFHLRLRLPFNEFQQMVQPRMIDDRNNTAVKVIRIARQLELKVNDAIFTDASSNDRLTSYWDSRSETRL